MHAQPLATPHRHAADAEAEFRQVLDARLRVLGPDHLQTLATRRWLDLLLRQG
jgi:hypothetical protein